MVPLKVSKTVAPNQSRVDKKIKNDLDDIDELLGPQFNDKKTNIKNKKSKQHHHTIPSALARYIGRADDKNLTDVQTQREIQEEENYDDERQKPNNMQKYQMNYDRRKNSSPLAGRLAPREAYIESSLSHYKKESQDLQKRQELREVFGNVHDLETQMQQI